MSFSTGKRPRMTLTDRVTERTRTAINDALLSGGYLETPEQALAAGVITLAEYEGCLAFYQRQSLLKKRGVA